jgi:hypothetical protein
MAHLLTDGANPWAVHVDRTASSAFADRPSVSLAQAWVGQDDVPGVKDSWNPSEEEEDNVDEEVYPASSS